jgi:hypothetical protein
MSFDNERSRIPAAGLPQRPSVDYASSEYTSPEQTISEYLPLSSPVGSPITKGRRVTLSHLLDGRGGLARLHCPLQPNGLHPEQIPKGTKAGNLINMLLNIAHKSAF